jgi:Ca2+-binding RTX toxin-like protein
MCSNGGVEGSPDNIVDGGSGNDTITADGSGVRVDGGAGADAIRSQAEGLGRIGTSQTLTGGSGIDSFQFYSRSTLLVEGDQNGSLSEGDVVTGLFPVITDYHAGEVLTIDPLGTTYQPPNLALGGFEDDLDYMRMGDHRHTLVPGNLTEPGRFTFDSEG